MHNVDSMLERSRVSLGAAGGASGGPSAPKSAPQARIRKEAADFFEFKPTAMTEEVKQDVELVKLRNFLDRKRHYKGSDHKWKPTTFQARFHRRVLQLCAAMYTPQPCLRQTCGLCVRHSMLASPSTWWHTKKLAQNGNASMHASMTALLILTRTRCWPRYAALLSRWVRWLRRLKSTTAATTRVKKKNLLRLFWTVHPSNEGFVATACRVPLLVKAEGDSL